MVGIYWLVAKEISASQEELCSMVSVGCIVKVQKNVFCVNVCSPRSIIIVSEMDRYGDAENSLARPTSRYILFDGENISFDASLVTYIYSTNIPPIMIINSIYETQNLLSL
jgi:hypothetical protein